MAVISLLKMATQRKNKSLLPKAILPFKPVSRKCWKNVSNLWNVCRQGKNWQLQKQSYQKIFLLSQLRHRAHIIIQINCHYKNSFVFGIRNFGQINHGHFIGYH